MAKLLKVGTLCTHKCNLGAWLAVTYKALSVAVLLAVAGWYTGHPYFVILLCATGHVMRAL